MINKTNSNTPFEKSIKVLLGKCLFFM